MRVRQAVRFAAREPGASILLVRMAAWVPFVSLMMKLLPLETAMVFITPIRRRSPVADAGATKQNLSRLIDLLLATDFWVYTPTCWKRAPVLYRYLLLNGVETRVVFGVRKMETGTLDGHAWLEAEGQPLLEKIAPDYKVTFSYPA